MNDLLDLAIKAHGGLNRWKELNTVKMRASVTGGIWYVKSVPDILKDIVLEADIKKETVTTSFPGQNKTTVFEPELITIARQGTAIQRWENPVSSFEGHVRETPWDDVHVAFFSSGALWTYLTSPFLYTYPGFVTTETEPWEENGETWRRLKITFPDTIASHTREQISFFGPDGLLRRHDYTVDILGGATGANYATNYRDIDGIIVPATRRIYAYEGDVSVKEPLLVAVDIGEIAFH